MLIPTLWKINLPLGILKYFPQITLMIHFNVKLKVLTFVFCLAGQAATMSKWKSIFNWPIYWECSNLKCKIYLWEWTRVCLWYVFIDRGPSELWNQIVWMSIQALESTASGLPGTLPAFVRSLRSAVSSGVRDCKWRGNVTKICQVWNNIFKSTPCKRCKRGMKRY